MAVSVASALVSSRLDQVNSNLYGAASKHINRLQRIQNALASRDSKPGGLSLNPGFGFGQRKTRVSGL